MQCKSDHQFGPARSYFKSTKFCRHVTVVQVIKELQKAAHIIALGGPCVLSSSIYVGS